jgi:hypothetical protein
MTHLICDNGYCKFNDKGLCQKDVVLMSNTGMAKVFWFSCWQFEKK